MNNELWLCILTDKAPIGMLFCHALGSKGAFPFPFNHTRHTFSIHYEGLSNYWINSFIVCLIILAVEIQIDDIDVYV